MFQQMADSPRFIDGYLLYLLARASSVASAEFHEEVRRRGFNVSNWRVLAALKGSGGQTVGELATICLANQPAMSKTVERLVRQGLVERRADSNDRRRVNVNLSEAGERAVDELIEAARAHQQRLVEAIGAHETETLIAALHRVIERSGEG